MLFSSPRLKENARNYNIMVINTLKFLQHKSMSTTTAHSLKAAKSMKIWETYRDTYSNSKETLGSELKAGMSCRFGTSPNDRIGKSSPPNSDR
jgi:archaellin